MIETLHLKLRLIADAIAAVQALTRHAKRPLLSLSDTSFHVSFADPGTGGPLGLPGALDEPGAFDGSGGCGGVADSGIGCAVFRAGAAGRSGALSTCDVDSPASGFGEFRVREVLDDSRGLFCWEHSMLRAGFGGPHQPPWLRLNLGDKAVDVQATLEPESTLAGAWRIRSLPLRLPQPIVDALKAPQGYPFGRIHYDLIPPPSSPCDLYSLGVLAVRTLLVSRKNPLRNAWDELLFLAIADRGGNTTRR